MMRFFLKKDSDKDLKRNYRRYYMRGKLDRRTFVKLFSASVIGAINRIDDELDELNSQCERAMNAINYFYSMLEDDKVDKNDSLCLLCIKTEVSVITDVYRNVSDYLKLSCTTRSSIFLDYLDVLEFNEKLGTSDTIRSILDEALADDEIRAYLDTNYLNNPIGKYGIPSDEAINRELANAELLYQIYLKNGSDAKKDLFKDYRLIDLEGNFLEPDYKQILDDTLPDYKAKLREHGFDEHGVRMR